MVSMLMIGFQPKPWGWLFNDNESSKRKQEEARGSERRLEEARGGVLFVEKFGYEVGAVDASQFTDDVLALGGLIPEEELALGKFVSLCLG